MIAALLLCLSLILTPNHVARVVDGDTFDLFAVGITSTERVRVLGVDAAEIRDSLGPAAKTFTTQWLTEGPFSIESCKRDNFGRLLGIVTRGTDTLAVDLIHAGLGVKR